MKALFLIGIGFGFGIYMGAGSAAKEIRSYTREGVAIVEQALR